MDNTISQKIKERLKSNGVSFFANDNISEYVNDDEIYDLQKEVELACHNLLGSLVIDTDNDHNTKETARRMAKMYLHEVFKGRYAKKPKTTEFPNAKQLDEIYTLGPITVRSACSHHLVPITGSAWLGVIPSEKVIGISKFIRVIDWIMSRPQIQEEATIQVADEIESLIKPKGIAVVIKAQHHCMTWRGVKEHNSSMVTSVVRGAFVHSGNARLEFFDIIKSQGF